MKLKSILKNITPPVVWKIGKVFFGVPNPRTTYMYEYVPEGWERKTQTSDIKGWSDKSILDVQISKWPKLKELLKNSEPLGISHESNLNEQNIVSHNTLVSFAYVLTLTSRNKDSFTFLDWGGGLGQYYLYAKSILPDVDIDYYCKDVLPLSNYGQNLLPDAKFYNSDKQFKDKSFDLVMASGSLMCVEDWRKALNNLIDSTNKYLYITRLTITADFPSFVVLQKPHSVGYKTEYLIWVLNKEEFLSAVLSRNFILLREFIVGEEITVFNSPGQVNFRGFLFQKILKDNENR